jgi:hypothetical protein
MPRIGLAKINAFDLDTHGFFFWNFRTELESKWDFQKAVANGWLPTAAERESADYTEKLEKICAAAPIDDGSSWVWKLVLFLVIVLLSWQGYKWFVASDRNGYTTISSAESIPSYENL